MKTLNHWNRLKVTHAVLTPRSELDKVQEKFKEIEPVLISEPVIINRTIYTDPFTLLPVGCWSHNNVGGIHTINLHSDILHSQGCQYLRGFSGRSAQEAASKAAEWVEQVKGGKE